MPLTVCSDGESACSIVTRRSRCVERHEGWTTAVVAYVAQSVVFCGLDLNVATHTARQASRIVQEDIITNEELFAHVKCHSRLAEPTPSIAVHKIAVGSNGKHTGKCVAGPGRVDCRRAELHIGTLSLRKFAPRGEGACSKVPIAEQLLIGRMVGVGDSSI